MALQFPGYGVGLVVGSAPECPPAKPEVNLVSATDEKWTTIADRLSPPAPDLVQQDSAVSALDEK